MSENVRSVYFERLPFHEVLTSERAAEDERGAARRFPPFFTDVYYPPLPPFGSFHNPGIPSNYQPWITQALKIVNIDPMIHENGINHRTMQYDHMKIGDDSTLIIRRGQTFKIKLSMDRDFFPDRDAVYIVFQLAGEQFPSFGLGTEVYVPVERRRYGEQDNGNWHAWVDRYGRNQLVIGVYPSPSCIVGNWKMQVDTKLQNTLHSASYNFAGTIVILFNAWCERDQVYMEDEGLRQEYVLRDYGYIFKGTHKSFGGSPWIYGQFQKNVTNCALMLISSVYAVKNTLRGDVLSVARRLTSVLHNANIHGVLEGKWRVDGKYDGRDPMSWTGSPEILEEFYTTKKTVKYGQCATFSGICVTVCRAIGIPSRSVTNFSSGNSTGNLKIEIFVDKSGQQVENKGTIWNYHVWTEMWVKRSDISSGGMYDGWNVIDATPQQQSDGIVQCGPAPVKAVKHGDVLKHFDTLFVYGEVNSDVWYWLRSEDSQPAKLLDIKTDMVGKLLVTQEIGSNRVNNLTDTYKFPEGSREAHDVHKAAIEALRFSEGRTFRYRKNDPFKWIECKLVIPNELLLGSTLQVSLMIRNPTKVRLTVKIFITLSIQSYDATQLSRIKTEEHIIVIEPKRAHEQSVEVTFEEYGELILSEDDVLHASYLASVLNKDYDVGGFDVVGLRNTKLRMTLVRPRSWIYGTHRVPDQGEQLSASSGKSTKKTDNVTVKNEITVSAKFTNPLPINLTGGVFKFASPQRTIEIKLDRDIEPHETFSQTATWEIPGTDEPDFAVVALFSSNEVKCIRGFLDPNTK